MRTCKNLKWVAFIPFLLVACAAEQPADETANWPQREGQFLSATEVFGPLRIREGEFEAEASPRPWSSWWFPSRETYLFKGEGGELSPLEKYDRAVQKLKGGNPQAASFEKQHLYDPNANSWEGLCNAWAMASILEPEPTSPLEAGGVTFGVGDLKALLVKSYEQLDGTRYFGQRYNGDRLARFDDIYPEQFHKILQAELFEKGRPFVMDKDPGVPVWNTPIWKAQLQIERDSADPRIAHVTSWVFGASPFVDSYDYVGTLSVVFQYTYDLYGTLEPDGSLLVTYGEWTGMSLDFHPDFVTLTPEAVEPVHGSNNLNLDIKLIEKIAASRTRSR